MGVEIDVDDALEAGVEQRQKREDRIVEIAESARSTRAAVMRSASGMKHDAALKR